MNTAARVRVGLDLPRVDHQRPVGELHGPLMLLGVAGERLRGIQQQGGIGGTSLPRELPEPRGVVGASRPHRLSRLLDVFADLLGIDQLRDGVDARPDALVTLVEVPCRLERLQRRHEVPALLSFFTRLNELGGAGPALFNHGYGVWHARGARPYPRRVLSDRFVGEGRCPGAAPMASIARWRRAGSTGVGGAGGGHLGGGTDWGEV